jgi:hypothetical protein
VGETVPLLQQIIHFPHVHLRLGFLGIWTILTGIKIVIGVVMN